MTSDNGTNSVSVHKPSGGKKKVDENGYKRFGAVIGGIVLVISTASNFLGNRVVPPPPPEELTKVKDDVNSLKLQTTTQSGKIAVIEERVNDTRNSVRRLEKQGERRDQQLNSIQTGVDLLLKKDK